MNKVFIDGQAGTTGLQIAERLSARADLQLLEIDAAERKQEAARRALMQEADVTILCLPDAAVPAACALAGAKTRLIDASSVHRTHSDWVYGLPELTANQRAKIAGAARVSNPGCYPQGYLLTLSPLVRAGLLPQDLALSMHAVSGYSGGGRPMIETYQGFSAEQTEATATRSYSLSLQHKHLPEMHKYSGLDLPPCFVPSVGTYYQGMLTHVPLHTRLLPKIKDPEQIVALYQDTYAAEPLVTVHPLAAADAVQGGYLSATRCNGTDRIELMVFASEEHILLVARYDNLGKGAAGVAVQNLNLMLGVPETSGFERDLQVHTDG